MAARIEKDAEPIPGYKLIERVGGGGFGEVWKCSAPGGMLKAIKFVFGDLSNASDGARAEQELRSLKRIISIRHPYILSLERYDILDGQLLIVMELADKNLWDRFKECRTQGLRGIPREELLRYMEEAAEALDLMNNQYQLQHLDIKPQNIFLVHQHVKVADFGLVKDLEGSQASITGGITPVYAAPETFDGMVSRFSDQYSLAIVYQELLTGQRPFPGNNVRQLILQHLQGTPNVSPLPTADQPHIARALSKKHDERFPSCRELVQCLRSGSPSWPGITPGNGEATTPNPPPSGSLSSILQPPSSGPPTANIRAPVPVDLSPGPQTHSLRGLTAQLNTGSSQASTFRPPAEITSQGILFPSLIVGLGHVGLTVLHRLREALLAQVGSPNQPGHLRFLQLDTDPDIVRLASRGKPGVALMPNEVLLAPLNRPQHYLKPRDGRPPLDTWLNPRLLYRIPRSQVTTGVRALGRLAFVDNFKVIARRLQAELEAIGDTKPLLAAAQQTGLGYRTNRPRVYLVTCLGGGTGSGMFLDVAYTLRWQLRQMGFDPPDLVGVLLLPPVDGARTNRLAAGNTFAALRELNHFGKPGAMFSARYLDREGPINDNSPPFNRCLALPLPEESDEVATQEVVDLCAQFLSRDLVSSLGKEADLGRAGLPSPPWESRGQYFQTVGLFRLSWPQHALEEVLALKLCRRLVDRWASKDAKPLRDSVQTWVDQQWKDRDLGAAAFVQQLQDEVEHTQGRSAEALFSRVIEPLLQPSAQAESPGTRPRGKGPEVRLLDPAHLGPVLQGLVRLIGTPKEDLPGELPLLRQVLRDGAERLTAQWNQKLAELPVQLIEEPAYRLAGAEEAIRQFVALIDQALQAHEPLERDLAQKATEAYTRLQLLAEPPKAGSRRHSIPAGDVLELLRLYPRWRFQCLVVQHLIAAFVSLRGHLSDMLREVNYCRVRLTELQRMLDAVPAGEMPLQESQREKREGRIGRQLFISRCKNIQEAADLFMESATPELLLELDDRVEVMLRNHFTALVHVCLSTGNLLKSVEPAMRQTAREFIAERLPPTSVAGLFFEQHPDEQEAEAELASYFDEAAPEIQSPRNARAGPAVAELCLVATPDDDDGRRLRDILRTTQPHVELLEAHSDSDVIIYRERLNLALEDLEQMGSVGREAYMQMTSTDNFTPHSRMDIDFRGK